MGATLLPLVVYYEDGHEDRVVADQRDIVIFERLKQCGFAKALEDMPITLFRHLAFDALVRTGQLSKAGKSAPRADWEATVIAVEPEDDEDEVAEADPGNPEATDETPSSSPARRGRASGKSSPGSRATSRR